MLGPGLLCISTLVTVASAPDGDNVTLRAHVLDLEGVQWRAEMLNLRGRVRARAGLGEKVPPSDGLQAQDIQGSTVVWTANPATIERLIAASSRCDPMGPEIEPSRLGSRYYVARMERIADEPAGQATAIGFQPHAEKLGEGLTLDMAGRRVPMGVLADVAIDDRQFVAFHTAGYTEHLKSRAPTSNPLKMLFGPLRNSITVQMQVPEVITGSASGQWLVPNGEAIVIALGVHTVPGVSPSGYVQRERVIVIDAGDVPDTVFATRPRGSDRPPKARTATLLGVGIVAVAGLAFVAWWSFRRAWRRVDRQEARPRRGVAGP